jgi:hypothetical protein
VQIQSDKIADIDKRAESKTREEDDTKRKEAEKNIQEL